MDEDEFAENFDLTIYNDMRAKYGAVGNFPSVWEKTCTKLRNDRE